MLGICPYIYPGRLPQLAQALYITSQAPGLFLWLADSVHTVQYHSVHVSFDQSITNVLMNNIQHQPAKILDPWFKVETE